MDHRADRRILQECIAGDREAQDAFVRRFSNLIYHAVQGALRARNLPCRKPDLEDLHNAVFVRLFEKRCRKLSQYQGKNGCTVSSWIRLIAVRTVLDTLRSARKDVLTRKEKIVALDSVVNVLSELPGQGVFLENAERSELVRKGLRTLPPRDRLFLKLHCEEGLSLREVARILKISESNAYSIKHRAIKRLTAGMAR
jgi:RNA polymerase sigma factor (sigma-70 family)